MEDGRMESLSLLNLRHAVHQFSPRVPVDVNDIRWLGREERHVTIKKTSADGIWTETHQNQHTHDESFTTPDR